MMIHFGLKFYYNHSGSHILSLSLAEGIIMLASTVNYMESRLQINLYAISFKHGSKFLFQCQFNLKRSNTNRASDLAIKEHEIRWYK